MMGRHIGGALVVDVVVVVVWWEKQTGWKGGEAWRERGRRRGEPVVGRVPS